MIFSLYLAFHMGNSLIVHLAPIPLLNILFIFFHLILTTNSWGHGLISTCQIRGAVITQHLPSLANQACPFGILHSRIRKKSRGRGGQGPAVWEAQETSLRSVEKIRRCQGKKQERRARFQNRCCDLCVSFRLFKRGQDWARLALDIIFRLVDCTSLRPCPKTGTHGWWLCKHYLERPITMFQREFKIELEHGDKSALSLLSSWAPNRHYLGL